jgi:hypothetical protein
MRFAFLQLQYVCDLSKPNPRQQLQATLNKLFSYAEAGGLIAEAAPSAPSRK